MKFIMPINVTMINTTSEKIVLLSLKIEYVLANSADPDEMPPYAAFHLGLHSMPKYPF